MEINILGLGPSLSEYDGAGITIGVNDIWKYHHADYVVCVDPSRKFTLDRLKYITESRPKVFFSNLNEYSYRPDYMKISLLSPRGSVEFFKEKIPYSVFSPFVAMSIAVNMGATVINVYGVDLVDHPNLKESRKLNVCLNDLRKFIDASPAEVRFARSSPIRVLLNLQSCGPHL